jgi:cell division protein FtsQ
MQPIDKREPSMGESPIEAIHERKQNAPNIAPLGEVSAEKMERLFGQAAPKETPKQVKLDPAPSRTKYKMQRLWLTPMVRGAVRTGVPLVVMLALGGFFLTNDNIRGRFTKTLEEARTNIQSRPEFQVELMKINGATEEVATHIRKTMNLTFPLNSFDLDLEKVKDQIEQLDAVKTAGVFLRSGGLLEVKIDERMPVVLWRTGPELEMLDEAGERAGVITSRLDRMDLPLIAGEAAEEYIGEAMALYAMAKPIHHRLRGLRRMGLRRWDMMLDRGQTIQLPEEKAMEALQRVLALDAAQKILDRDVVSVDMRDATRPILRLTDVATQIIRANAEIE